MKSARLVNQRRIIYVRLGPDGLRALVRGDNDIYIVFYNPEKGMLKCTCPAGMRGKLCKHALAVKTYVDTMYTRTRMYVDQPKPPSSALSVSRIHHA
ncbi:hypothetical protein Hbut_0024 [Hyperthermus butylicus DSM 5456]|uniref:SWIM-type domain-containing protein n=1 Tax=Hyperthermus butylicus (strain DSM 5456 / JCM 9403 / PLM1-5) TaxID=415426 RepID=A2BIU6_HYPBU|nr:hypothetical protein Hbut_0024 [Hyperthermus butylicus DSM 5456]